MLEYIGSAVLNLFRKRRYKKIMYKRRLRDRDAFNNRIRDIQIAQERMRKIKYQDNQRVLALKRIEMEKIEEERKVAEFLAQRSVHEAAQFSNLVESYRGKKLTKDAKIAWGGTMHDLNTLLNGDRE